MSFDLKVTGGLVFDGTGTPPRRAAIGIKDGRIVEVGDCTGSAARVVDAEGACVTPGFVDIHTHYDGQVTWDGDLAPSSSHGVTTAVMGNCGVGFAPVRPADRARLIELMEGVEDIPGAALAEGIRWRWESFPEYLEAADALPHAIDFAAYVPHDALRVFVMGERGAAGEPATPEDVTQMRAVLRQAVEAGAVGFSTGRTDNHRTARGKKTPANVAPTEELVGLAGALDGLSHGAIQAVSDFDMEIGPEHFDAEFDVLERTAAAAPGHPFSLSLMQRDMAMEQWRHILRRVERATAGGVPMHVQVAPRAIGVLIGLDATFHPFIGFPSYKQIAHLPLAERVRLMRDPAFKARLFTEKSERIAGDGSSVPPLVDKLLANIDFIALKLFRLGSEPNYEPTMEESLCAEARARGVPSLEAIFDALLENDGSELLYFPIFNYSEWNLDNVGTMLNHPLALPGLGDGGAHVGTTCDGSFPTFLLTHWTRDRKSGRIPLERAIKMLSHDTARFIGMHDRGVLAPGQKADLNLIDYEALRLYRPRIVRDLPAGGRRLLQDVRGYRATIVGGHVVREDGTLTGARPGRLVRVGHTHQP